VRPVVGFGALRSAAERTDRVGVRLRVGKPEPEEAHEGKPILTQVLAALVRQRVHGLQQQDLEHQHMIEGRPATLYTRRPKG
jgi:hypothetical protein